MQSIDFSTHGRDIDSVYKKIVTGDESTSWAVFSPDSTNSYSPSTTGSGDINEFVENFDEGKVQFGLIRVNPPGSDVRKLLLIGWCPDSVPIRSRSSFSQNFATVTKILHGYHVQVTARDEDDLDVNDLLKKVSDAAGARYSIQSTAPNNFGNNLKNTNTISKPITPKPVSKFIPKPIAPKPVAPKPVSPFIKKNNNDDDGWDGAEKVEERDLMEKPLEDAKSAWKPIGKVNLDDIRSEAAAVKKEESKFIETPIKRTLPPAPAKRNLPPAIAKRDIPKVKEEVKEEVKEKEEEDEDLSDEEKAFREKRKLFDQPKPVEEKFNKPIINSSTSRPVASARPGSKVPLPVKSEFSSTKKHVSAVEDGKTPAQVWAEKHGKYDSSVKPEIVNSSNDDIKKNDSVKESVSDLTSKFKELETEKVEEKPIERSVPPPPKRVVESVSTPAPVVERAVPPAPVSTTTTSAPVPLPPRKLEPEVQASKPVETEPEEASEPVDTEPEIIPKGITATAQFDYEKQDEDEIEFADGEVIVDIEFAFNDWWVGTNAAGERGQFPANYVKLDDEENAPEGIENEEEEELVPEHTDKTALAAYDYEAVEENEITFKEGDKIVDVFEYDEHWWYGTIDGKRGLFPSDYVELSY